MGASCSKEEDKDRKIKQYNGELFFDAYSSIKNILLKHIYKENKKEKEVYLIKKNSIERFLNKYILKDFNFFEYFSTKEYLEKKEELEKKEKELQLKLEDYLLEKNPTLYYNYDQYIDIISGKEKNEFIIAGEDFVENFKVEDPRYKDVLIFDICKKDKIYLKIKLKASGAIINAREKDEKGFFEFYEEPKKEEKKEEGKENKEAKGKENEEKSKKDLISDDGKKDILLSMKKSICYCLIRIKIFKGRLQTNSFKKENNSICKKFLELIGQENNNQLDFTKIFDLKKQDDLHNVNNIIEFLFSKMHEELVYNKINNSNGLIYINIDKESTLLSDIFYFQKIVKKHCDKCNIDIWNEPYIMKKILFDYQSLINFKNQKNSLDIYDCFDYFVQINNFNENCKKCSNPIAVFH